MPAASGVKSQRERKRMSIALVAKRFSGRDAEAKFFDGFVHGARF
jgi:hypothetical protein